MFLLPSSWRPAEARAACSAASWVLTAAGTAGAIARTSTRAAPARKLADADADADAAPTPTRPTGPGPSPRFRFPP